MIKTDEIITEIEGEIRVKRKRIWSDRYGKIQNGFFLYFKPKNKTKPRNVLQIKDIIIQTAEDLNSNENLLNIIMKNSSEGMNI